MDDIDVPALSAVILPGDVGKLRGHPERLAPVIPEGAFGRHRHPTDAGFEVQQLVDLRLVLQQDVFPATPMSAAPRST